MPASSHLPNKADAVLFPAIDGVFAECLPWFQLSESLMLYVFLARSQKVPVTALKYPLIVRFCQLCVTGLASGMFAPRSDHLKSGVWTMYEYVRLNAKRNEFTSVGLNK